eukprot:7904_1
MFRGCSESGDEYSMLNNINSAGRQARFEEIPPNCLDSNLNPIEPIVILPLMTNSKIPSPLPAKEKAQPMNNTSNSMRNLHLKGLIAQFQECGPTDNSSQFPHKFHHFGRKFPENDKSLGYHSRSPTGGIFPTTVPPPPETGCSGSEKDNICSKGVLGNEPMSLCIPLIDNLMYSGPSLKPLQNTPIGMTPDDFPVSIPTPSTQNGILDRNTDFGRLQSASDDLVCSFCDAVFATNIALRAHLACHSGTHPYTCTLCQMTFVRRNGLTRHRRSFVCRECARSFCNVVDLKCHGCPMIEHRDFYIKRRRLNQEIANPQLHKCSYCYKRYSYPGALETHMKKYHGEDGVGGLFSCPLCAKVSTTPKLLSDHMVSCHPNSNMVVDKIPIGLSVLPRLPVPSTLLPTNFSAINPVDRVRTLPGPLSSIQPIVSTKVYGLHCGCCE